MAAAEARTVWQRTANRYFFQEDAKRAPKLACCPPTLSSKQTDSGPADATDDHQTIGFMPSKLTPSYSNLPYDSKWRFQMEPHYAIHRGLKFDLSKSSPMTASSESSVRESATMSEEGTCNEDLESFLEVKKPHELGPNELGAVHDKIDQDFVDLKNMTAYYESLDFEMVGGSVTKSTSDFSSSVGGLSGEEKLPWWRVTHEEELASIVAQKSLHCVENCDLPPPQKRYDRRDQPYIQGSSVDDFFLSLDWEAQSNAMFSPSSGGSGKKHWSSLKEGPSCNQNEGAESFRTNNSDTREPEMNPMSEPCKAKLLEALCHSQTRARVAEKAAKQAHTEKDHLLTLFFRQASQLFAYKQWFKLLQLEALLLESKEGEPSPFTSFPLLLPQNPGKLREYWQKYAKAKRRKRDSQVNNDIGKYCVALAVGFTLVSAGLILGWTAGWLLPNL